jgi:hypothetical protein
MDRENAPVYYCSCFLSESSINLLRTKCVTMRTQHEGTTTTTGVSANQPTLKGQPQNELDQKFEQKFYFKILFRQLKHSFLGTKTFSITTLSIMKLSIMTLSITDLIITQHKGHIELFIIMHFLIVMMNAIMLSVDIMPG